MQTYFIKPIDLPALKNMQAILSLSAGYAVGLSDEVEYLIETSPTGWFLVQSLKGETLGFVRYFPQGTDWSLGEIFVDNDAPERKSMAAALLKNLLDSTPFAKNHRLRFDIGHTDAELNETLEELGYSDKKQAFHFFEMSVTDFDAVANSDSTKNAKEIAETLSFLNPVSEIEAQQWIGNDSLRSVQENERVTAAAQVFFSDDHAEIIRIATHRKHLRQGHAKRLLTQICAELNARGIPKLVLKVEDVRTPAILFYKAFGFTERPEKKQIWHSKYF